MNAQATTKCPFFFLGISCFTYSFQITINPPTTDNVSPSYPLNFLPRYKGTIFFFKLSLFVGNNQEFTKGCEKFTEILRVVEAGSFSRPSKSIGVWVGCFACELNSKLIIVQRKVFLPFLFSLFLTQKKKLKIRIYLFKGRTKVTI